MKKLENLSWQPSWVTHLGCLKGCLDYLGSDLSPAWLWGGTGHAFFINIHPVICPSGPTAWKTGIIHKLGKNVGYEVECILGFKQNGDFQEKQQLAWDAIRQAIDNGLPCFGWELDVPEYYVIYGYDDVGYHFKGPGCDEGKGPYPWEKLGDTGIGVTEAYVVKSGTPADDAQTVKEALHFAIEASRSPEDYIHPGYKAGLPGYDLWLSAFAEKKAEGFGTSYNAAVWSECRTLAAEFLREAKSRLDGNAGSSFDAAIASYATVAQNLQIVAETFPFLSTSDEQKDANVKDPKCVEKAVACLQEARRAEAAGLESLKQIIAEL